MTKSQLKIALSQNTEPEPSFPRIKSNLKSFRIIGIQLNGIDLLPIEEDNWHEPLDLINRLLEANKTSPSLQALRVQAEDEDEDTLSMEDGLLLHEGRLLVPDDGILRTEIIKEAHDQIAPAHPGQTKTYQLLRSRYYWRGMKSDIERYVRNCNARRRAHVPRDKTPGLLHPLPIPDRPWQHICVDFKSCPKTKRGFDATAVFIDRLTKHPIYIPCYKTVTAQDLARMCLLIESGGTKGHQSL